MRNHLTRTTALAAASVLTLSLTACSGDDEATQAFCDSFDSLESLTSEMGSIDPSDPEAASAQLEEITSEIESIEAPEEVADSFDVVSSAFRTYTDAATEMLNDPENTDEETMTEATEAMSNEEFTTAAAELDEFTADNCG